MPTNVMETWLASSHLSGANSTYIEDIYESYLTIHFLWMLIGVKSLMSYQA